MRFLVAGLCCSAVIGASMVQGSAGQSHFVANGDLAEIWWSELGPDGTLTRSGFLVVLRGGQQDDETLLIYQIADCGPDACEVTEAGNGLIPSSDLTGSGSNSLRLETNTAAIPDFARTGAGGQISVEWRANHLFSQTSIGTTDVTNDEQVVPGTFRARTHGKVTSKWATTTGTVIGSRIGPPSIGTIGTSHQVIIEFCTGEVECP